MEETYASVSAANVDSDDYPEIVVPTMCGIKVSIIGNQ